MVFGRFGPDLRDRARGIDDRPISMEHEVKSVSNEVTFVKDIRDATHLEQTLRQLSESVGRRLRKDSLAGTTVQIKLRWEDFTTITRQVTLSSATNLDQEIFENALTLFKQNWPYGKPVRLIGVGVSNLGPPMHQLELWGMTTKNRPGCSMPWMSSETVSAGISSGARPECLRQKNPNTIPLKQNNPDKRISYWISIIAGKCPLSGL